MEKKLQKIYLLYLTHITVQGLPQAHYQILSIIFLKEFIKLNANSDTHKKCEICRIKYKYCHTNLKIQTSKII